MKIEQDSTNLYWVIDGADRYGAFTDYAEASDFIENYLSVLYEFGAKN